MSGVIIIDVGPGSVPRRRLRNRFIQALHTMNRAHLHHFDPDHGPLDLLSLMRWAKW